MTGTQGRVNIAQCYGRCRWRPRSVCQTLERSQQGTRTGLFLLRAGLSSPHPSTATSGTPQKCKGGPQELPLTCPSSVPKSPCVLEREVRCLPGTDTVQLDQRRTSRRRAGGCCHPPPHRASQSWAEPESHPAGQLPPIAPLPLPLWLALNRVE